MVKLNDGWDPPNFGLLDNYPGNGAKPWPKRSAKVSPRHSCTEDQVNVRTGTVTGPVEQGMNTRFDMYDGSFNDGR